MRRRFASLVAIAVAGCAMTPAPLADLSGTRWRVVQVNGQATPAQGDYSMRFEGGGIGARFGCNSMGGRYRVTADVLTVTDLASTLMGCPEPAATFEREGSAVLQQPMRMAFSSNERMFLSNAAGSIALDPLP